MPNVFLSFLLYLVSELVGLLLVNAIGHNTVLAGASSQENHKPPLICGGTALNPTPNAYDSENRSSFS